jgi:hypothetical protein
MLPQPQQLANSKIQIRVLQLLPFPFPKRLLKPLPFPQPHPSLLLFNRDKSRIIQMMLQAQLLPLFPTGKPPLLLSQPQSQPQREEDKSLMMNSKSVL